MFDDFRNSNVNYQSKVALVTTSLTYSGAEALLVELAIRLQQRGWEVTIISMLPPVAYTSTLEAHEIPIECLYMSPGIPDIRAVYRLAKFLKQWSPDIVHSHMVHANLLARTARLLHWKSIYISTAHNIDEGGKIREFLYRITDPLCHQTTNVSRAAVDRYVQVRAVPKNKIQMIPNGIDTHRFIPNPSVRNRYRKQLGIQKEFLWIAVGRFEEAKDYPNMFKAMRLLIARYPKARLIIVGHGRLEENLLKAIKEDELEQHILCLGVRTDVQFLMNAADAYVMSSAWEGLPLVLLEAAASQLPVVATDVGGNREIVRQGVTGHLVSPGDPYALSSAMQSIMDLPQAGREQMGKIARQYIQKYYDIEVIVSRWESLYRNYMGKDTVKVSARGSS